MDSQIKTELHKLIDDCDNDLLLSEARSLLKSGKGAKDWWNDLTEKDRNLVLESEEEYKKGKYISNDELMHQLDVWKKK